MRNVIKELIALNELKKRIDVYCKENRGNYPSANTIYNWILEIEIVKQNKTK